MRRLLMVWTAMCLMAIPSAGDCPSTCECKWKSGKESVLCEGRNLTGVPQRIDSGTQLLDLSNNNLTTIKEDEFSTARLLNLQKVFLSRCSIRVLHRHAFRNLINLVDLDLSNNLLSTVPSHTFEFLPLLTELKLNGNPIPVIRNNSFKNVPQLNKLDLSDCRISYVEVNAFAGLEPSLEWLKLNKNRLTSFRGDSVMVLGNLKGLELAGNEWNCSCTLRPLREWMLRHNIPHTISPVCRQPSRIANRPWDKLQLDDFACLPKITTGDSVHLGFQGENVSLGCVVKSVPFPSIKWLRKEKVIANMSSTPGARYLTFHVTKYGSNLTITSAELTDSGEYTCRAENRAGRAEAKINLTISVKPQHAQWSGRVVIATAIVIILFSLAGVLLLVCVCCLWRKQQGMRRQPPAATGPDAYEMNHKTPNSYEKVKSYGREMKIDETKGRGCDTHNGHIGGGGAEQELQLTTRGTFETMGDRSWGAAATASPIPSSNVSPDLHIPALLDQKNAEGGRSAMRMSPAPDPTVSAPGVASRKESHLHQLYSSHEKDNYPDLLETDKYTLPRRGYRPKRTRTGSFGSESMSPLLQGSSDESCDSTMPFLDFPDPYPELDKFLKEYRNLQEQLYKMKESCENLKQDNLRFQAESGRGPKTISRLMDEVYKGGEVEPMYSVYRAVAEPAPIPYTASQHLLNDSLGNVLLSAATTPNNNPLLKDSPHPHDDFWLTKGNLLNTLSECNSNSTKSFYES